MSWFKWGAVINTIYPWVFIIDTIHDPILLSDRAISMQLFMTHIRDRPSWLFQCKSVCHCLFYIRGEMVDVTSVMNCCLQSYILRVLLCNDVEDVIEVIKSSNHDFHGWRKSAGVFIWPLTLQLHLIWIFAIKIVSLLNILPFYKIIAY